MGVEQALPLAPSTPSSSPSFPYKAFGQPLSWHRVMPPEFQPPVLVAHLAVATLHTFLGTLLLRPGHRGHAVHPSGRQSGQAGALGPCFEHQCQASLMAALPTAGSFEGRWQPETVRLEFGVGKLGPHLSFLPSSWHSAPTPHLLVPALPLEPGL